jgi:hypothetical protein
MQRLHMRFDIFFYQVQQYNADHGILLLDRTVMCDGMVDAADLLWVGRLAVLEEEREERYRLERKQREREQRDLNSPSKKPKQNHQISKTTLYDSNFLTLLYRANDTTKSKSVCTKRQVDTAVDSCSLSSSNVFESSVGFTPRKRIKLINGSFFINQLANVVTVKSAYYVSDENYDTIIDSGASSHIINDTKYATLEFNYRPANPNYGVALGDNSMKLRAIGYCDIGILKHIMIVPKMTVNLISGSRLDLLGYPILIKDRTAHLIKGTELIVKSPLIRGLYHEESGVQIQHIF